VLVDNPFLILIVGGLMAGISAVLLRRAALVYGAWIGAVSLLASMAEAAAFVAALLWAATTSPVGTPPAAAIITGIVLALAGGAVAGWALRVRGIGVLRSWNAERFEKRQPYRTIRRPVELGVMASAAGLCALRPATPVWVWLTIWLAAWSLILELGDWELRLRLPACRDYLKRTPRYLPRLRRRRAEEPAD